MLSLDVYDVTDVLTAVKMRLLRFANADDEEIKHVEKQRDKIRHHKVQQYHAKHGSGIQVGHDVDIQLTQNGRNCMMLSHAVMVSTEWNEMKWNGMDAAKSS